MLTFHNFCDQHWIVKYCSHKNNCSHFRACGTFPVFCVLLQLLQYNLNKCIIMHPYLFLALHVWTCSNSFLFVNAPAKALNIVVTNVSIDARWGRDFNTSGSNSTSPTGSHLVTAVQPTHNCQSWSWPSKDSLWTVLVWRRPCKVQSQKQRVGRVAQCAVQTGPGAFLHVHLGILAWHAVSARKNRVKCVSEVMRGPLLKCTSQNCTQTPQHVYAL